MPAARYWRIARIETYLGGDLELSEVALYEGAARVDGAATVSAVVAPVSGALSDLGDASFSTSARWAGDAVRLPGFAVVWDFGAGVTKDVTSVGVAGPSQAMFAHKFALEYSSDGSAWTTIYATATASKWPGASSLYTLDSASSDARLRGFVVSHFGASAQVSVYEFDGSIASILPSVAPQPDPGVGGYGIDICASQDGAYIAVTADANPRVRVYGRQGRSFTEVFNSISGLNTNCVAFSADGVYFAVGYSTLYLSIYKNTAGSFTPLPNPATMPTGQVRDIAFSQDGVYMACAHDGSPYLTIYKRSGDTFTKLANPASLPPAGGEAVAFSPDGALLVVGHTGAPYMTVYSRSGDTFTKLANQATMPITTVTAAAFSHDGEQLALALGGYPRMMLYSRSGDVLTSLSLPAGVPDNQVNGVAYSYDSAFLAVVGLSGSGSHIALYSRSGSTYTKLADPVDGLESTGTSVAWLPFSESGAGISPSNFDASPLRGADPVTSTLVGEDVQGVTHAVAPPPLLGFDMHDAGRGRITGTVKEKNTPANTPLMRRVVLLSMPGSRAIRETWSDPVTGVYEFNEVAMDRVYTVVSYDHTGIYRGVVADNLTPEVMP